MGIKGSILTALISAVVFPLAAYAAPEELLCTAHLDSGAKNEFHLRPIIDKEKQTVQDADGVHDATVTDEKAEWKFVSPEYKSQIVFTLDRKTGVLKLKSTNPVDDSGNYTVTGNCKNAAKNSAQMGL